MSEPDTCDRERAWTLWACPDCGRDRGPIAQYVYRACECGSHRPQREVEVVPAERLRGAVEEIVWLRATLGRVAAGHSHPSKLAGEAVDQSIVRVPLGGQ
jgi:hypothetical protein